jgi:hypothetical protein
MKAEQTSEQCNIRMIMKFIGTKQIKVQAATPLVEGVLPLLW